MEESNMQYNSSKEELVLPEYGRNVQLLVKHAKTIENRELRQAFIERVIRLMHQMNPQNRNIEEYKDKLWGHVFHIADYDIDVMPDNGIIPTRENARKRPDIVGYPHNDTKYRHYGYNVQKLVKKALDMEPGPKRTGLINAVASYMKLAYKTWNREHYVSDDIIKNDLTTLSDGGLKVEDGTYLDNLSSGGNMGNGPVKQKRAQKRSNNYQNNGPNKNYRGNKQSYKRRK